MPGSPPNVRFRTNTAVNLERNTSASHRRTVALRRHERIVRHRDRTLRPSRWRDWETVENRDPRCRVSVDVTNSSCMCVEGLGRKITLKSPKQNQTIPPSIFPVWYLLFSSMFSFKPPYASPRGKPFVGATKDILESDGTLTMRTPEMAGGCGSMGIWVVWESTTPHKNHGHPSPKRSRKRLQHQKPLKQLNAANGTRFPPPRSHPRTACSR